MHMRNWTYVAIHLIASKIASIMPNIAYVVDAPKAGVTQKACRRTFGSFGQDEFVSDGGHSFLTLGAYRSKALSVVKPHEELEPVESDHLLRRLIENPNPVDTTFDLLYELTMFEELCGVSYLWTVPNDYGMPSELWVIPSHWVWPKTGGGRYVSPEFPNADKLISYYEIRPWGGMGSSGVLKFPPQEVIMNCWKSPLNKIDGYSKLSAIAQWIDSEESISKSRWAQFINQARPELWVELAEGYEDPNDDRIARMEAKFAAKLQGEFNYGRPLVTPPGAKVTPLSFNPTEMAYFQCLDEETECLTSDGWKKYNQLTTDTRIACYSPASASLVYRTPSAIHINPYKGKMHKWSGQRVDALMTPNHRCYIRRPTTRMVGGEIVWKKTPYRNSFRRSKCRQGHEIVHEKVWDFKRADELAAASSYGVLASAPATCYAPSPVSVDYFGGWRQREEFESRTIDPMVWLRFIGYYLSEGCLQCREVGAGVNGWEVIVTQKKYVESFKEGIEATPFAWKTRTTTNGCTNWIVSDKGLYNHLLNHCGKGAFEKKIPSYVKAWPAEYLKVLLGAMIEGDGMAPRPVKKGRGKAKSHTPGWSSQYYTSSKQLADDTQEIAVKCGYYASITEDVDKREEYYGTVRYTVNITSRATVEVTADNRSEVDYDGNVWCVTVPTGLFVVRRNGKAHITGNSEEQIRDMILSAFAVPPAAVGIVKDLTYGSILATLAALCSFCLNPRLVQRGENLTKHLACRWDRPGRKVRIWWDDTVPADPAQVNADLAQDLANYSITPNEQRALRGRKAYRYGGDDPIVQGPGGPMPLPINTANPLDDLAKLVAPMVEAEGSGQEEIPIEGETPEQTDVANDADESDEQDGPVPGPGIENPNSEAEASEHNEITKSLDSQGGEMPVVSDDALAKADFITYPQDVEGSNCGNCIFNKNHVCTNEAIYGQPVNYRNCCALWDGPGTLRHWKDMGFQTGKEYVKALQAKEPAETVRLLEVPDVRQPDDFSCGACVTMAAAAYFGIGEQTGTGPQTLDEWKQLLGTTVEQSTSPESVVQGLQSVGLAAEGRQNMTVEDLEQCWRDGKPVICPIQEYGAPDKKADFAYGHYVVVIGCSLRMGYVFVQDPAIDNIMEGEGADAVAGRMMIDIGKWQGIWHDEDTEGNKYIHYGIVVGPDKPGPVNRLKGAKKDEWKEMKRRHQREQNAIEDKYQKIVDREEAKVDHQKERLDDSLSGEEFDRQYAKLDGDFSAFYDHTMRDRDRELNELWRKHNEEEEAFKQKWRDKGLLGDSSATDETANLVEEYSQPDATLGNASTSPLNKGALDSVATAGKWLAEQWQRLEARYGRATALSMAVAAIATAPLPGSIPAIIAAAEAIRGLRGGAGSKSKGLAVQKWQTIQYRDEPYGVTLIKDDDKDGWYAVVLLDGKQQFKTKLFGTQDAAQRAAETWVRDQKLRAGRPVLVSRLKSTANGKVLV